MRYPVRNPDIVFVHNGERYAIEVETGANLKNKEKLGKKLEQLCEYPYWFFVVTKARLKKEYMQFGPTFTKGEVRKEIERIFSQR